MHELVIDSFAGGGGTSTGIEAALGRSPDIALNHDPVALAMHRANHPATRHVEEDVVTVDARGLCAGRPVGLFWLSPDCKHHSKAKGGKPRDKNIRGLAWTGFAFVKALPAWQRPRVVILENVEEFAQWGPLMECGRPCPDRRGATFRAFVAAWEALGYVVEWRELRACDFGAPTIRKRLFVVMRRDGHPIVWPARTHGNPKDARDAAEIAAVRLQPWRTAAEIIDWSLPCPSIFETSAEIRARFGIRANRPLASATMARIAKGTMRYVVTAAKPFIVPVTHQGDARVNGIDEPLRTQTTARRGEHALVTPFVTKFNKGSTGHRIDEPVHTITAAHSETHPGGYAPMGIVAPHLVRVDQTSGKAARKGVHGPEEPVRTVATAGGLAVVAPFLARTAHGDVDKHGKRRGRGEMSAEEPVPTVLASNDAAVVAPFLAPRLQEKVGHEPRTRSLEQPAATITAGDNVPGHLVTPFLVPRYGERPATKTAPGQEPRTWPLDEPAPTITPTGNEGSLAAVHLSRQFGASVGSSAEEPVGTITAGGAGKAAVVAAFLAQHNTGVTGHDLRKPVSTVTTGGRMGVSQQAVVAAHLTHAYTSNTRGGEGDPRRPLKTVLAGGNHAATVYAFLAKYYGEGLPSQPADDPLHTITAKPRHGLVTVHVDGEPFVIVDIGMRMLTPRERFGAQGFPPGYIIAHGIDAAGERIALTLEQQGRMCGNSVSPVVAEALIRANYVLDEDVRRPPRAPRSAPLLIAAE